MANLKNIIDELKTVAEAFTSLASTQSKRFKYDRLSYINGGNNDYPMIYVDSAITKDNVRLNRSFLPSLKTYTISVYLFDTYHQQEKQSKSIQQKQGELEDLFEQYLAEVKSRLLTSNVDISNLDTLECIIANDSHNDKLIQVSAQIQFQINSSCTTGTFNY